MTIGFIGNFEAPHSTENDRVWSFNKLGHNVIAFQENKVDRHDILSQMEGMDWLFYSHTHGWEIQGLREVFIAFKMAKIPTVSVHLDRWAWLEREKDIGQEATWFTEHLFMADASPEAVKLYEKHNLNWHYLKPGVIERDCYMANPDPVKYKHEIVFIGSKNYHKEYSFRPEMIDYLKKEYGDRFGHYEGGIRGHDLNVLMATAKIVVGDSIFGGRPNYVSDRYYETRGRGGFLIHPKVEGVDYAGVGFYLPKELLSLRQTIDYYLEREERREIMRSYGHQHVKNNETYTQRTEEMCEILT